MNELQKANNEVAGFHSAAGFDLLQRMGKLFSAGDLVPKQYQNNVANCTIACNMAIRMNADPLMVMQNLYIVHGTPGFSSKFLISCFNSSGKFSSLRFEFVGEQGKDNWGCFAWAIENSTGEKLKGSTITIEMAK